MTPEQKDRIGRELAEYITSTMDEWLRQMVVDVEDHPLEGVSLRIRWDAVTDGAMIANLSEIRDGEPIVRFGVSVDVQALEDLPPIGPENDLGVYGIDESDHSGVLKDEQETAALASGEPPRWMPATFLMCLAGDRIRVGGQETDVLRSSSGVWHANNGDAWHPTPWVHTELRMDLTANPGFQQYPPDTACEILMSPERYAVHLFMQTFPGTQIIS
jgi:hypothetical protein